MTGSVRPRTASLLLCGTAALALAATLSGCGSSAKQVGGAQQVPVSTPASASAAPSSASAGPSGGAGHASPPAQSSATIPAASGSGGTAHTPEAVLAALPAGAKYTAFESATASSDGRTLFVGLESMGGACGQYDVVLHQSGASVEVGLVHMAPKQHVMCPQYVGPMRIAVSLSAPLAGRPVIDLANGQSLNVG